MQIGIRNVVRITNSIEMPSTPSLYLIGPSQAFSSTNWKAEEPLSKLIQMSSDTANVTSVVHSAIQRALPAASRFWNAISSAPTSGRNVTIERMGVLATFI